MKIIKALSIIFLLSSQNLLEAVLKLKVKNNLSKIIYLTDYEISDLKQIDSGFHGKVNPPKRTIPNNIYHSFAMTYLQPCVEIKPGETKIIEIFRFPPAIYVSFYDDGITNFCTPLIFAILNTKELESIEAEPINHGTWADKRYEGSVQFILEDKNYSITLPRYMNLEITYD